MIKIFTVLLRTAETAQPGVRFPEAPTPYLQKPKLCCDTVLLACANLGDGLVSAPKWLYVGCKSAVSLRLLVAVTHAELRLLTLSYGYLEVT